MIAVIGTLARQDITLAKKTPRSAKPDPEPGTFESLGKKIDDSPKVRTAEEAVQRAKAELEKAQARYGEIRRKAAEELRGLREKNLGDLLDDTMSFVRRRPGPGIAIAALAGFVLGRLFRR